jgi:hypothetical protein
MAGCAYYAPPYGYRDGYRAHYWGHPTYYRY